MENNRNFLIAMALSIAVLIGWQFLVVSPRMEAERQRQAELAESQTPANDGSLQTPQTPAGSPQESLTAPAGRESVISSPQLPAAGDRAAVARWCPSFRVGSDLVREAGRQPAARGEPPRQALGLVQRPVDCHDRKS